METGLEPQVNRCVNHMVDEVCVEMQTLGGGDKDACLTDPKRVVLVALPSQVPVQGE